MATSVREATTPDDYAAFGQLVSLYEGWLRRRYEEVPDLIAAVRVHQDLEGELAALPEKYGPPNGIVLLLEHEGEVAGGVAYRDLSDGNCEMKRMYVLEKLHGLGLGRRLCQELIARAQAAGYKSMVLDTGFLNTEALALYRSLGFHERGAYAFNPPEIEPHLHFMERSLA